MIAFQLFANPFYGVYVCRSVLVFELVQKLAARTNEPRDQSGAKLCITPSVVAAATREDQVARAQIVLDSFERTDVYIKIWYDCLFHTRLLFIKHCGLSPTYSSAAELPNYRTKRGKTSKNCSKTMKDKRSDCFNYRAGRQSTNPQISLQL